MSFIDMTSRKFLPATFSAFKVLITVRDPTKVFLSYSKSSVSFSGVGTDNMIVEKKLPRFSASARGFKVLTNNFKSWKYHGKSTCCVKSIGIPSRPISTKIKIIGVGLNRHLYFKTSLKDSWTFVPKSGSVRNYSFLSLSH